MGCGALAVGVWLLVTDFSAREISVIVHTNLFEIGTYLILGGGGLIALLAFCGCCGTMREDKCILGFVSVIERVIFKGQLRPPLGAAFFLAVLKTYWLPLVVICPFGGVLSL